MKLLNGTPGALISYHNIDSLLAALDNAPQEDVFTGIGGRLL